MDHKRHLGRLCNGRSLNGRTRREWNLSAHYHLESARGGKEADAQLGRRSLGKHISNIRRCRRTSREPAAQGESRLRSDDVELQRREEEHRHSSHPPEQVVCRRCLETCVHARNVWVEADSEPGHLCQVCEDGADD